MKQFASGRKRNYYGKADVTVYRLHRDGKAPPGRSAVFGANVVLLTYGDAFWPTYTTGDNTHLVATDSMKNFIQRKTLEFCGDDLVDYCRYLGRAFLATYAQAEGVQVSALEVPFSDAGDGAMYVPAGRERAAARVELAGDRVVEATAGLHGFRLLRLNGSAFKGFVRDEYTTLCDAVSRPLYMWLDLEWRFTDPPAAFHGGTADCVRRIVMDVFHSFESRSIQQVIYRMGVALLEQVTALTEVRLEASNRTWDTVVECDDRLGVYTDPRRPYGCLGLTLTR